MNLLCSDKIEKNIVYTFQKNDTYNDNPKAHKSIYLALLSFK